MRWEGSGSTQQTIHKTFLNPSFRCLPSTAPFLATHFLVQTIHELVMELGYEDTSTEVYTVDSQVRPSTCLSSLVVIRC